jgi:hypothetical protein
MPRRRVQTSATLTPPVKVAAKVAPPDPKALLERYKDFPSIDVISRRFNNPNDPGSLPILLKDEDAACCTNTDHQRRLRPNATVCHLCDRPARKWYVRYFNLASEGRNAQMRSKGYQTVRIAELMDADDIGDLYTEKKDGVVRRGDRGQEVLGKMPLPLFLEIKRRQEDERMARAISAKAIRSDLEEAAGKDLGDEAGQSLKDGVIKVESVTRHSSTLGDEAQAAD